jgi:hypothetical protein
MRADLISATLAILLPAAFAQIQTRGCNWEP